MKVLVIGAAGRVGSAALAACLAKHHTVTAFVRNPAKLPFELRSHPRLRIYKGDATCHHAVVEAIRDQDAVIQASVYGSASPFGSSDSERVVRCVVGAIKEVQLFKRYNARPIRLWVMSGQVLLDVPGGRGKIEGDLIPIHPEHYQNYAFLQQDARDVNWSLLCPGKIDQGEPTGPVVATVDQIGLWQEPWFIGSLPFVGNFLSIIYNFSCQKLTYVSVGNYLADHLLSPAEELKGKRVGILETPSAITGSVH